MVSRQMTQHPRGVPDQRDCPVHPLQATPPSTGSWRNRFHARRGQRYSAPRSFSTPQQPCGAPNIVSEPGTEQMGEKIPCPPLFPLFPLFPLWLSLLSWLLRLSSLLSGARHCYCGCRGCRCCRCCCPPDRRCCVPRSALAPGAASALAGCRSALAAKPTSVSTAATDSRRRITDRTRNGSSSCSSRS